MPIVADLEIPRSKPERDKVIAQLLIEYFKAMAEKTVSQYIFFHSSKIAKYFRYRLRNELDYMRLAHRIRDFLVELCDVGLIDVHYVTGNGRKKHVVYKVRRDQVWKVLLYLRNRYLIG